SCLRASGIGIGVAEVDSRAALAGRGSAGGTGGGCEGRLSPADDLVRHRTGRGQRCRGCGEVIDEGEDSARAAEHCSAAGGDGGVRSVLSRTLAQASMSTTYLFFCTRSPEPTERSLSSHFSGTPCRARVGHQVNAATAFDASCLAERRLVPPPPSATRP